MISTSDHQNAEAWTPVSVWNRCAFGKVWTVWTKCGRGVSTLIPQGFQKLTGSVDGGPLLYRTKTTIGVHVHTDTTSRFGQHLRGSKVWTGGVHTLGFRRPHFATRAAWH